MIALSLDELLAYTDEERGKWRDWLEAHPRSTGLFRLQPDGRFATVGALIDHIFLVEARHLARLQRASRPRLLRGSSPNRTWPGCSGTPAGGGLRSGITCGRWPTMTATTPREFVVQSGTFDMTPRKLLLHIGLHETRHWAQIALGVRQAGLDAAG